ncbi:hypothetical protein [Citromicrobium sp. JLT1363]|uniref:hypothetical protein n=1 Tax=Citromicrobium sp. JLT1363 TaxID=517722 RepID=UPI001111FE12|nr:hypothetical protein [Citromicrobium sp. JLT1363]
MATEQEQDILAELTRRYEGATLESMAAVLCPLLVPIASLDKTVFRNDGENHWRASFTIKVTPENRAVVVRGRTGKFVPGSAAGANWREIAKGRICDVDHDNEIAHGEIYVGTKKVDLEAALQQLSLSDLWEVDQYGASAKVLSALSEYYLYRHGVDRGYTVTRMPEDMARHLGSYANFDFVFEKDGVSKRVESKSLWGTDVRRARLIHSTTTAPKGDPANWSVAQKKNYYPTSSCKFETQDFFAVGLFLRTGRIGDIAFARSVPEDVEQHGLPRSRKYPEHVNQNPLCEPGDGVWFASIDEVWDLA